MYLIHWTHIKKYISHWIVSATLKIAKNVAMSDPKLISPLSFLFFNFMTEKI